jgi:hypothetical protein
MVKNSSRPIPWKRINTALEAHETDILTKEKFGGKYKLHVEFRVPYTSYRPPGKEIPRADSGIYVQGRYEIQVLDTYDLFMPNSHACGAIYNVAAPKVNACKAPTVWQSFDIEFSPVVCKDGQPIEPARMTVWHNNVKIHDNVPIVRRDEKSGQPVILGGTGGSLPGDPCQPGPIMLQFIGHPVQYRNIWLLPT